MKQGILIVTWSGGKESFKILINSLSTEYPVIVVVNDGNNASWITEFKDIRFIISEDDRFELGAITKVLELTDWDEFILLQDTIEIKNNSIFEILFNNYPNQSVAYNPHFQMYLGKFRRETLEKLSIPVVTNKIESVAQEGAFLKQYMDTENVAIFNPHFIDGNFYGSYEELWGRKNLILSDEYLIKRKGTWDASQLQASVALIK